jgi:hypothetical protein
MQSCSLVALRHKLDIELPNMETYIDEIRDLYIDQLKKISRIKNATAWHYACANPSDRKSMLVTYQYQMENYILVQEQKSSERIS